MKNKYEIDLSGDEKKILVDNLMKNYQQSTNMTEMIMLKRVLKTLGKQINDWIPE